MESYLPIGGGDGMRSSTPTPGECEIADCMAAKYAYRCKIVF